MVDPLAIPGTARILSILRKIHPSHRIRSCVRKVKYPKESSAINAVASMKRKTGGDMEPYKCRYCDGFHIGHPMPNITVSLDR